MDKRTSITFIGAGNMARCLIGGLCHAGHVAECIRVSAPTEMRTAALAEQWGVKAFSDNAAAVVGADVVVLAVKPQLIPEVLEETRQSIIAQQSLVVSVASGARLAQLQRGLQDQTVPIVACMPNTPAMVGAGASALAANAHVDDTGRALAESLLRSVGLTVWLNDESEMGAVTALSGCGPAYFFRFVESLQRAAAANGLRADVANTLAVQTALGAAKMALECDEPVAELRRQVTAPGGQTEQAIAVMEAHDIDGIVNEMFAKVIAHANAVSVKIDDLF